MGESNPVTGFLLTLQVSIRWDPCQVSPGKEVGPGNRAAPDQRIGMGIDSRDRKRKVEDMNSTQKEFSLNCGASRKEIPIRK